MQTLKNADVLSTTLTLDKKRVLDIGCGAGQLSRFMARKGAHVIGLESSGVQLSKAIKGQDTYYISLVHALGQSLPFKDQSFNILVFFNSLHHIPHKLHPDCFDEALRVLVPNGLIYISEPIAEGANFEMIKPVDDETHVRALALDTIKMVKGFGFQQLEEKIYNHPVKRKSYEEMRDQLIGVDPAREKTFIAKDQEMRATYERLGVLQEDGSRLFQQPTRMNLLQKLH